MVNDMELYLMSFLEGYLGPEKAYRLRNNAYKWRFKDAWRYGMMHRNAKKELEDGFSRSEVEAMDAAWELTVDAMTARVAELEAEVARLRGIKPEFPPRPPAGGGLPRRYGIRWNGPEAPMAVPMDDGYWTPWHLADRLQEEVARMKEAHEQDRHEIGKLHSVRDRLSTRIAELEESLKCECQKNELAKKYIETLIHPV